MKFELVKSFEDVAKTARLIVLQLNEPTQDVLLGEKLLTANIHDIALARKTAFEIHKQAKKCIEVTQTLLLRGLGQCVSCIHTPLHIRGVNFYLYKLNKLL